MKVSTDWLREYIALPTQKLKLEQVLDRLTMAGLEVEKISPDPITGSPIFEVEVTTNRPDWLSHIGVAREIAAVENINLQLPKAYVKANSGTSDWSVQNDALEACPYYSGVYIEGVNNHDAPEFMRKRLEACGVRSISLIVDITNYVLLETGQPLHAFDARKLQGKKIFVRYAKKKEKFVAIDESELTLTPNNLVIADENGPIALAGVMGGRDSEVTHQTMDIFLESALFAPAHVRKTSREYGIITESSYRFERTVDPEGVDFARERALYLIQEYANPRKITKVVKAGAVPRDQKTMISLSTDEVCEVMGITMSDTMIKAELKKLGLSMQGAGSKMIKVGIPSFRSDLTRPIDLIEEVARLHGFHKIPESLPRANMTQLPKNSAFKVERELRSFLSGVGLSETITFSLIASTGLAESDLAKSVEIVNPQNKELNLMRPTLVTSLLQVVQKNWRAGVKRAAFYEIANVYEKGKGKKGQPKQKKVVAFMFCGNQRSKQWLDSERPTTFYDLKGCLQQILNRFKLHDLSFETGNESYFVPGQSEQILAGKKSVGFLGAVTEDVVRNWDIDEPVYYAEVDLQSLIDASDEVCRFEDIPKYPAIERDLSVVVSDAVKADEVAAEIRSLGEELIRDVEVFDLFRGGRIPKGHKSLAFRIKYQSAEKTLVSDEVQELHTRIADTVVKKFQAVFQ